MNLFIPSLVTRLVTSAFVSLVARAQSQTKTSKLLHSDLEAAIKWLGQTMEMMVGRLVSDTRLNKAAGRRKKVWKAKGCAKEKDLLAQLDALNFLSAGMRDLRVSAEHADPAETAINYQTQTQTALSQPILGMRLITLCDRLCPGWPGTCPNPLLYRGWGSQQIGRAHV